MKNYDENELNHVYKTIFNQSFDGIVITSSNNIVLDVNEAFCRITGYSKEEIVGNNPSFLRSGRQDPAFYQNMWRSLSENGVWSGEIWNKRKSGEIYAEWLKISAVKDSDNNIKFFVGMFTDITQYKRTEERILYLTNYDPLTNLPNRQLFELKINQTISDAKTHAFEFAIVFIDLDQFKRANDILGHAGGDILLKDISQRLLKAVRKDDTIARLGGDVFGIILRDISPAKIDHVMRRVVGAFQMPYVVNEHELTLTCSAGISVFPHDAQTVELLMKQADIATYNARELGKNQYSLFYKELNEQIMERIHIENLLRYSIERNELYLVYHPQVSLKSGEICGIEVLVRWRSEELGLVSPVKFIPIAEDSGFIIQLGEWVFETACKEIKSILDLGIFPKEFKRLAINLSAGQYQDRELFDKITSILKSLNFDPKILELELTESMVMENVEQTIDLMQRFRAIGMQISIDDFGTGYSSLSYLKKFPINHLKIDQSFIREIKSSTQDEAISKAIIALSHSMGLNVIAEGVETLEQLDFLRNNDCDEIQGFYFSKPLTKDNLEAFLKKCPKLMTKNNIEQGYSI